MHPSPGQSVPASPPLDTRDLPPQWVRLQEDFYKMGSPEPQEGWALVYSGLQGQLLERWDPPAAAGALIGSMAEQGGHTSRYWVVAPEGVVVRERPWGRVLTRRRRGGLLRVDFLRDGWVRLEEDFVESGPLSAGEPDELGESALLEGWVLADGRDVGLARQLQQRAGEPEPPAAEGGRSEEEICSRRRAKKIAHEEQGEDWSLRRVLADSKVSEEVAGQLEAAGVRCMDDLIATLSRGDQHEELRKCGVGKLGPRTKLATLVQPYWQALSLKEQGNTLYKDSRFEEAAAAYTAALELMPCTSVDLALTCHSNRAVCHQQMREPEAALRDVLHVIRFDPTNEKAQARRKVYEQAMQYT